MRNVPSLETVYQDYAPKGVKFFYIYKALAHPGLDGYVNPFTLEERLTHIQEAKRKLGTKIPWIADSMSNEIKHAFGNRNNSEFVFDPEGKLLVARTWSDPEALRWDLEDWIGALDNPTTVRDLDMPELSFRSGRGDRGSATVPRLERPIGMQAIKAVPIPGRDPFYVKLRVEVERDLLGDGNGQLYLGFHLDPIYGVHWNNLVDPLQFEFTTSERLIVTPAKATAPKVEQESDSAPREFLLDAARCWFDGSVELTVRYFACNEAEGWCRPVTQQYNLYFEPDRDAGREQSRGRRGFRAGGFRGRGDRGGSRF